MNNIHKKYYLLLACLSVMMSTYAQRLFTNNNSLVAINTDVPVTIQGDVTNSGVILNEGALRLYGDWTNSGEYSSVSGTFSLLGMDPSFEPGTWTYNNLSINTTNTLNVNSDLMISGVFELNSGIVNIPESSFIHFDENTTLVETGASYIVGTVYSSQQGDVVFPVGTSAGYLPLILEGVQSTEAIGVQVSESGLTSMPGEGIDALSPNRFWQILENSSFIATGMSLPVLNETFIEDSEDVVIGYASTTSDAVQVAGLGLLNGDPSSGTLSASFLVRSGYYVTAEQSVGGPPITVINVVTPLQDGKHDFLRIENIEFYENNKVEVFDRQGNKVFSMSGYNNTDRVFRGTGNVRGRGELTTGNYYYTVEFGSKREAGFVYIKN